MCSEGMHARWISINLHTCMLLRFSLKFSLLTSWIVVHRDSGDLKSNEDQWKQEKHLIHSYPSVSLSGNVVLLSTHVVHSVWNRCQLWNLFGEWEWISSVNLVVSFSNQRFVCFLEGFEQVPPFLHELMVCIPSPIYTSICVRVFRACDQLWWN